MEEKIVIAGFGGQGVLSLGQLLAYSAIKDDKEVTWLPSYGPEMRGGTSNCSVVISDTEVASPIISAIDCLIAMNKPSLAKFCNKVKAGGTILVNSSLITEKVERDDVGVVYINANDIAVSLNNPRCANIVMLGAYIKERKTFTLELVADIIREKFKNKPKAIPSNLEALYFRG